MTVKKPGFKDAVSQTTYAGCVEFVLSVLSYNHRHEDQIPHQKVQQLAYDAAFAVGRRQISEMFGKNKDLQDMAAQNMSKVLMHDAFEEGFDTFFIEAYLKEHITLGIGRGALQYCQVSEAALPPEAMLIALERIELKTRGGPFQEQANTLFTDQSAMIAFFKGDDLSAGINKKMPRPHTPFGRRKPPPSGNFVDLLRKDINNALSAEGYQPFFKPRKKALEV